jgi:hypothetical protein
MRELSSIIEPHVLTHSGSPVSVAPANIVVQSITAKTTGKAAPASPPVGGESGISGVKVTVVFVIIAGGVGALGSVGRNSQHFNEVSSAQTFDLQPPIYRELPHPVFVQIDPVPVTAKFAHIDRVQLVAKEEPIAMSAPQFSEITPPSSSVVSTVPPDHLSAISTTVRTEEVASLFSRARPRILDHLKPRIGKLTQADVEKTLSSDLTEVIEKAAGDPKSGITFEALTGKLKVESSMLLKGVKVTGGEVNVYKVTAVLAGGIVACALTKNYSENRKETLTKKDKEMSRCIEAALAKVKAEVADLIKPATDAKDARE